MIRPVEFQGVIQRTQDVGQLKQNEDTKGFVDQSNIQTTVKQEEIRMHETVVEQENAEKQKKYDAKEKGNGAYSQQKKGKQGKKKEDEEDGKVVMKSPKSFDVKI